VNQIFRLLVINPGSTSTKIAIYDNEKVVIEEKLFHPNEQLNQYKSILEQYNFRKTAILETLHKHGINLTKLKAIVGRGGLLRPLECGTYLVNQKMVKDLISAKYGEHASNLGAIIAFEIANQLNIEAYIVDPVVVDELQPVARISGIAEIERRSIFHALNQKSVARKIAKEMNLVYDNSNFVVCHMGGGISVGAHFKGKVIDVNNALSGEGPFSPERAGTLPIVNLVQLCFSYKYSEPELLTKLIGNGGLVSYLNTTNASEVEKKVINGEQNSRIIYDAMAYQIAKEIGAYSVVLKGEIDAIILTGGMAFGSYLIQKIKEYVEWIAPIKVVPGENELMALAEGTLRVLRSEELAKVYD